MLTLTSVHVAISLVGIFSGLVVAYGLLVARRLDGWTALFLTTTVATSVTGFFFPFKGVTPGDVIGVISLVVLAVAIVARYSKQLAGGWRRLYAVSAVLALYLNVFVLIVQLFEKVPTLKALAPTQKEAPFVVSQLVVVALFVALAVAAAKRFREPRPFAVQNRRAA